MSTSGDRFALILHTDEEVQITDTVTGLVYPFVGSETPADVQELVDTANGHPETFLFLFIPLVEEL